MSTAEQPTVGNPFPSPTALEKVLLRELVRVARTCYDRGWSFGTAGNFSLRGSGGIIWQSPSGLNKGDLNPDLFVPVTLASGQVVGPLRVTPSLEMPVHLGAYLADTSAGCVVHTHPPHLVARSRAGVDLTFQGEEMQKPIGSADHTGTLRLPVIANVTSREMQTMASKIGGYLVPGVPLIILAAHGVYAWGKTPMAALAVIEAVEFLCQTQSQSR